MIYGCWILVLVFLLEMHCDSTLYTSLSVVAMCELLVFTYARSCVILARPCWLSLEEWDKYSYFHAHGRVVHRHGRAWVHGIECVIFLSNSIPKFVFSVFLPCLVIQVIVSNSIYVCIMHSKMDVGEILEIF